MALLKCKMCGGDMTVARGLSVVTCDYCGTRQTVAKSVDDEVSNLFNRAIDLRLNSEFDRAEQTYERILEKDNTEAEAHWGLLLCRFGIEYVKDPKTGRQMPTCHRASFQPITSDTDYLAAVKFADNEQKTLFEQEAKLIEKIQTNIINIAKNEAPFDVFICYKETDEAGKRTTDSVIANDIHHQLTQEGFKVFYAPITLEDKLGQEYEPYIFAALNSAKVMLVVGTKPEHFESVWVKNEWSRFVKLMAQDKSKMLIPCYRDMDPYNLPDEFAHLQAQDMSKIGFVNDLVRGIKKVLTSAQDTADPVVQTPAPAITSKAEDSLEEQLRKYKIRKYKNKKTEETSRIIKGVQPINNLVMLIISAVLFLLPIAMYWLLRGSNAEPTQTNIMMAIALAFSSLLILVGAIVLKGSRVLTTVFAFSYFAVYFASEFISVPYKSDAGIGFGYGVLYSENVRFFLYIRMATTFLIAIILLINNLPIKSQKFKWTKWVCLILLVANTVIQGLCVCYNYYIMNGFQLPLVCMEILAYILFVLSTLDLASKKQNLQNVYSQGKQLFRSSDIEHIKVAKENFESISGYKKSDEYVVKCEQKIARLEQNPRMAIISTFAVVAVFALSLIITLPLADNYAKETYPAKMYEYATYEMEHGWYYWAASSFSKIRGYKDSSTLILEAKYRYVKENMDYDAYATPEFLRHLINANYKDSEKLLSQLAAD